MYRASSSNPNAFNSDGLPREAANLNRRSQQRREQDSQAPITHTVTIDTGYFHCQEHRFFYPNSNYEIVQIQTTDREPKASIPRETFYILNFPIDQLIEHPGLVGLVTRLNPSRIALCNPLSSEVFLNNYRHILDMTLNILGRVVSLTKITLCVDILNDALVDTLRNQSHLREVELILPSSTSPEGSAHVREVLNRDYALGDRLPQVKFFKIPLEIAPFFRLGNLEPIA